MLTQTFDPILLKADLIKLRRRGQRELKALKPWKNTGAGFKFLTTDPQAHKRMEWMRDVIAKLHEHQLGPWAVAWGEEARRLDPELEGKFDTNFTVFARIYRQGIAELDRYLAADSPIFTR